MFDLQPHEKRISLFSTDIQKMTPLHCAAMFDHPELVEYLVNEGADINSLGKVLLLFLCTLVTIIILKS